MFFFLLRGKLTRGQPSCFLVRIPHSLNKYVLVICDVPDSKQGAKGEDTRWTTACAGAGSLGLWGQPHLLATWFPPSLDNHILCMHWKNSEGKKCPTPSGRASVLSSLPSQLCGRSQRPFRCSHEGKSSSWKRGPQAGSEGRHTASVSSALWCNFPSRKYSVIKL